MRSLLLLAILACIGVLAWWGLSQPARGPVQPISTVASSAAQPASSPVTPLPGSIGWTTLTAEQHSALSPLAGLWGTLRPQHQRKWIALAHNFNRMTAEEQSMLQGRMTEWAKLSAAQRTQARLNFGEARRLSADKKRAKWEEYQALSADERERLAKDRPKPPVSAAPALRPTPAARVARRPVAVAASGSQARSALDGTAPGAIVNSNTLLPQPVASEPSW